MEPLAYARRTPVENHWLRRSKSVIFDQGSADHIFHLDVCSAETLMCPLSKSQSEITSVLAFKCVLIPYFSSPKVLRQIAVLVVIVLWNVQGHRMCRLDGTVTKKEERQRIIDTFTRDARFTSFLLTTGVTYLALPYPCSRHPGQAATPAQCSGGRIIFGPLHIPKYNWRLLWMAEKP